MKLATLMSDTANMTSKAALRLREMGSFLENDDWYSTKQMNAKQFPWNPAQVQQLQECDYLVRCTDGKAPITAQIFPRTEQNKQRHRVLLWPQNHNLHLREHFVSEVKDCCPAAQLGNKTKVRVFDLVAGFYQVALPIEDRQKTRRSY